MQKSWNIGKSKNPCGFSYVTALQRVYLLKLFSTLIFLIIQNLTNNFTQILKLKNRFSKTNHSAAKVVMLVYNGYRWKYLSSSLVKNSCLCPNNVQGVALRPKCYMLVLHILDGDQRWGNILCQVFRSCQDSKK